MENDRKITHWKMTENTHLENAQPEKCTTWKMTEWKMHTLKNGRKFTTWKITKNTLPEYVRHFSSVNEVVCQNLISCIKVLVYTYPDTISLASLIALFPI